MTRVSLCTPKQGRIYGRFTEETPEMVNFWHKFSMSVHSVYQLFITTILSPLKEQKTLLPETFPGLKISPKCVVCSRSSAPDPLAGLEGGEGWERKVREETP